MGRKGKGKGKGNSETKKVQREKSAPMIPVSRRTISKVIKQEAKAAGIKANLTHDKIIIAMGLIYSQKYTEIPIEWIKDIDKVVIAARDHSQRSDVESDDDDSVVLGESGYQNDSSSEIMKARAENSKKFPKKIVIAISCVIFLGGVIAIISFAYRYGWFG
jgi:hypothetical protein